ncbi:MAG: hypothetical protein LBM08_11770 [Dysgonamonadaceae bacterium]|jgi:hypothetical protein|nr:hypothetical protein [Dysgonamonadaceae bacterium]
MKMKFLFLKCPFYFSGKTMKYLLVAIILSSVCILINSCTSHETDDILTTGKWFLECDSASSYEATILFTAQNTYIYESVFKLAVERAQEAVSDFNVTFSLIITGEYVHEQNRIVFLTSHIDFFQNGVPVNSNDTSSVYNAFYNVKNGKPTSSFFGYKHPDRDIKYEDSDTIKSDDSRNLIRVWNIIELTNNSLIINSSDIIEKWKNAPL